MLTQDKMKQIMEADGSSGYENIEREECIQAIETMKTVLDVFKYNSCDDCKTKIKAHLFEIYQSLPSLN